jgi:hypothetical protein
VVIYLSSRCQLIQSPSFQSGLLGALPWESLFGSVLGDRTKDGALVPEHYRKAPEGSDGTGSSQTVPSGITAVEPQALMSDHPLDLTLDLEAHKEYLCSSRFIDPVLHPQVCEGEQGVTLTSVG